MENQRIRRASPSLRLERGAQLLLHDLRVVAFRDADPVRDAEHVAIDRQPRNAERMAEVHKRFGLQSAMMGLRQARRSIESQSAMLASERAKALAGIDEAIREVEKQRDE